MNLPKDIMDIVRVNSKQGRYMKRKRQSTVEPVFGTLKEYMGLRKVNTLGIKQANKIMHLVAIAYNLKKYLKFVTKTAKSGARSLALIIFKIKSLFGNDSLILSGVHFRIQ